MFPLSFISSRTPLVSALLVVTIRNATQRYLMFSQTVAAFFCVSKFPTCTGCQVIRKKTFPPLRPGPPGGKRRAPTTPRRYCWRRFGNQTGRAGVGEGVAYKLLSFFVLPVECIRRDQRRIIPSTSFLVNNMFGPQTAVVRLFSTLQKFVEYVTLSNVPD